MCEHLTPPCMSPCTVNNYLCSLFVCVQDFKEAMQASRKARGKGTPKKGTVLTTTHL